MNEFDQFVKHQIRAKYYIRYADDFVILSQNKEELETVLVRITDFLWKKLLLRLHPNKVSITTLASGVDYLGYVHFSGYRVLRHTTVKRMFRGIRESSGRKDVVQSYLGLLQHGNTKKLQRRAEVLVQEIRNQ